MSRSVKVEICVGDLESALEADRGGADRVELCDNLAVGGTTPSAGAIAEACARLSIPVHVLIRPRAGDFLPSEPELAAMRRDIDTARSLGASGVVLGVLRPDATIDRETTATLAERARPMSVTFHRAFDQVLDPALALETLIALGIDRVLTSGCHPTALEGIDVLRRLVEQARHRINILAGGRIALENLAKIFVQTGVPEVHLGSAVTRAVPGTMNQPPADGFNLSRPAVDAARVRQIVELTCELVIG
jgi:copper homeostasis protein